VFFEAVNVGELQDKVVDEWTYAELLDPVVYKSRMLGHWSTFVMRSHFEELVAAGISHVRIPVGYWYWDVEEGEPFPAPNMDDTSSESPLFYLKRALTWMDELGLKGLIDLHAGPGSQNGYDNSGRRGEPHWVDDTYPENRANLDRTVRINEKIAQTMRQWVDAGVFTIDTLYGIGLLNEPHICGYESGASLKEACLGDFYPKGYEVIRKYFTPEETAVVVDVAALPWTDFNGRFPADQYQNFVVDAHHYQCFGNNWVEGDNGWDLHLAESCRYQEDINTCELPVFTGEFCMAATECQKYLQGGYNTPYEPGLNPICRYYNGDFPNYDPTHVDFLKNFFLAQIDSYESGPSAIGWFMWTMKVEGEHEAGPEWDFLYLWRNGVIPSDLCSRDHYC